jgi:hypothetical protein
MLIGYARVSKADVQDTTMLGSSALSAFCGSPHRVGLAAARETRGAGVGRPGKLSPQQQQEVICTVRDGSKTAADAARLFGMHRSNISRLLARAD